MTLQFNRNTRWILILILTAGSYYRCLSAGERIAIGVCVGVGVFLIFTACGMMRRR